ncbi:MAG: IreB family regulatory phosphoprotein [Firmicutes bacterium]|nr:IreB family regulatory phosphoprotein [Bacillota bacterium]
MEKLDQTMMFKRTADDEKYQARDVFAVVYEALKEKGYNPINQIVGYLLSGDPAYITSHKNARVLIRKLERDELLEELVGSYLKRLDNEE